MADKEEGIKEHTRTLGMGHYILDENNQPVEVEDILEWARLISDDKKKRVDYTKIGNVTISTVFLGLDHGWGREHIPILFETMIFGGRLDNYQNRYETYDQAVEGHKNAIAMVIGNGKMIK